jgi:hypothetical protein
METRAMVVSLKVSSKKTSQTSRQTWFAIPGSSPDKQITYCYKLNSIQHEEKDFSLRNEKMASISTGHS